MTYEPLASFEPALARFLDAFRPCFKRDKTFGYLQKYMVGLMTDLKRKSIEPTKPSFASLSIVSTAGVRLASWTPRLMSSRENRRRAFSVNGAVHPANATIV